MKVLITGIAGFIGFHTALKFKANGHEVCGFDNYNTYYDPKLKHQRTGILVDNGITVHYNDLTHTHDGDVSSLIGKFQPDLVIHLAAMAGVRYSMDHPKEYEHNNIYDTELLIKALEKHNVKNVIYASTSSVMNGNPVPWNEDAELPVQKSPYGVSKVANENQFHESKISNAVGLRFFTVYGPWGRPDMALFDFTKNILADHHITLFNYGDMKRDFTYIDDIVQGIVLVADNMTERDIYCIGYGKQVELQTFLTHIESNLFKVARIKYAPMHPADAPETFSDTTKLQKLGYKPTTPIEVGVKNFIDWYKDHYL